MTTFFVLDIPPTSACIAPGRLRGAVCHILTIRRAMLDFRSLFSCSSSGKQSSSSEVTRHSAGVTEVSDMINRTGTQTSQDNSQLPHAGCPPSALCIGHRTIVSIRTPKMVSVGCGISYA
ncbi:hypothetical protein BDR05DRAFT_728979 [Suillus weaverae]|nr:hypothetical protein BDR05DRAFT_728979 [Suillus weaverae]